MNYSESPELRVYSQRQSYRYLSTYADVNVLSNFPATFDESTCPSHETDTARNSDSVRVAFGPITFNSVPRLANRLSIPDFLTKKESYSYQDCDPMTKVCFLGSRHSRGDQGGR